ncbi:helical backbone metal receptor [Aestuariivivens sediminis]|uniref:helical backbone metal receptor n=1 Tax=Aestuariivivens sediminis TaxID=2913557 RepID=UPI001F55B448|nr:helical backbone metal receptor [Aestuariivivens sediminis]
MKDQLHRTLQLNGTPGRIVSLVPSQTELLCDLGLKGSIVGVTKFCVHPHGIREDKFVVGGTKAIHIDAIRALNPDIILCNKEENTKTIVEDCTSICPVHVSHVVTISDCLQLIEHYGDIFDSKEKAHTIVEEIKAKVEDFKRFIAPKPRLKVAYFIWRAPLMVAGNKTFINELLNLNKFENVYANQNRYPEIRSDHDEIKILVDVVLLSSEPFPFKEKDKSEFQHYYPNAMVELVDGQMFSWYGSRLTISMAYFKTFRLNLQNRQP